MKKTILAFIGARPQIIKHSAIERAVKKYFSEKVNLITIHSGQHYSADMSEVFFEELGIASPDVNFNVGSLSHAKQIAMMMEKLDVYLDEHPCDIFLVYGDTNSTLAGAMVAAKRNIPLVHIEAGLRSFDKAMPEEINRIMTDHVSSLLFCPTKTAVKNLAAEAIVHHDEGKLNAPAVFACGDIMYDNSLYYSQMATKKSTILQELNITAKEYILATIHRNSNTDDKVSLSQLFEAFLEVIEQQQMPIVLPLHPRTKKMMEVLLEEDLLRKIKTEKLLKIISPVGFVDMIALEKNARLIATDSGGVQKEAYFFNVPVVVLRPHTEWVELVENGCAKLVGTDKSKIIEAIAFYMSKKKIVFPTIFGDGQAAKFIVSKIIELC